MKYDEQVRLARYYNSKGFITNEIFEGFQHTGNKGILGECRIAELYNIKGYVFDNKPEYDILYRGMKIQFKFNGSGSSASTSEIVRKPEESKEKHADRIMRHYDEIDEFWIVTTNNLQFNKTDVHCYDREEFKQLLLNHNCKIGKKIRLKKGIIEKFNKALY